MTFQNKKQMKIVYSAIFVLISTVGFSQKHQGEIKNVEQTGLHQITIAPNIRAVAKDDLRHFKIFDSRQKQIPYAFVTYKKQVRSYNNLTIISKNSIPDSITTLVIQNEASKKINQFNLQIENTSLTKNYSVSGSNDGKEWFGLVANETLADLVASSGTSLTKTIHFPTNTYPYLKVVFVDKNSLPINILSVGIAETQIIPEKLIEVTGFKYKFAEDKIRKVTTITFSADMRYEVDAIAFTINNDYFNRSAKLIVKRAQQIKKRKTVYDETLAYFDLNSKTDRTVYLNTFDEKEFTIEIENKDNQPLEISDIKLFQKPVIIVSNLTKDENYQVVVDQSFLKPSYDLGDFVAETVGSLPEAKIINFSAVVDKNVASAEKSFWQTSLFMWICIIFGGAIVSYFAYGLLKDMKDD